MIVNQKLWFVMACQEWEICFTRQMQMSATLPEGMSVDVDAYDFDFVVANTRIIVDENAFDIALQFIGEEMTQDELLKFSQTVIAKGWKVDGGVLCIAAKKAVTFEEFENAVAASAAN